MAYKNHTVSVIIPAHNEELSISRVVSDLMRLRCSETNQMLLDDIIVCNNGSTDNTAEQAKLAGASVFDEGFLGYGAACLKGIKQLDREGQSKPDFVVFVDGDYSVKANELPLLLDKLIEGNDLVVGNRVTTMQERAALSIHQRFGNYLASYLIRRIWNKPVNDLGPFRAMQYHSLLQLDMQDKRFGWTVEMQVKAIQAGMSYAEIPVSTLRRIGQSKISGTVKGTIGAALGIFGKVFQLYREEATFIANLYQSVQKNNYEPSAHYSKHKYSEVMANTATNDK